MRIHTDIIKLPVLFQALPKPELCLQAMAHGSRKRANAFEVRLEWLGPKVKGDGRRKTNSGNYGAAVAATYDEWGEWIARLYVIDPTAIIGPYNNVDDFHLKTDYAYLPTKETEQ